MVIYRIVEQRLAKQGRMKKRHRAGNPRHLKEEMIYGNSIISGST
jgi:hypothetical protein